MCGRNGVVRHVGSHTFRHPFATHLPEGDCIAVCLTGAATAPAVYLTAGRAFLYCPDIHQTRCHASGTIALSVGDGGLVYRRGFVDTQTAGCCVGVVMPVS